MKNLFNDISNEERQRILEMHTNATKRNYLMEAPPTTKPVPNAVQQQVKGTFTWNNMVSVWQNKNQGYTNGDDFMWFAKKGDGSYNDMSVLYLYTLTPGGGQFTYKYTLNYGNSSGAGDVWTFGGIQQGFGAGQTAPAEAILTQLFVTNIENTYGDTQKQPIQLDTTLYSQFLKNYVEKYPTTPIARALAVRPKINKDWGIRKDHVEKINNSELYRQLATNVAQPTGTQNNQQ